MVRLYSIALGIAALVSIVISFACSKVSLTKEWTRCDHNDNRAPLKNYCVIDLSGGGDKYAVTYLDAPPTEGWGQEYKMEKLVLRLITPGRFKFRGRYDAEITKPYYIGVFEVTCRQYAMITGEEFKEPPDIAIDCVAWWEIRGDCDSDVVDIDWPRTRNKHPKSFMALLESRTGKRFDLPTEFQWEYACGAESDSDYFSDDCFELRKLPCKCKDSWDWKTIKDYMDYGVGTRAPNSWGLYDMHGNVSEWCLDAWDEKYVPAEKDSTGSSSSDGQWRIVKGGNVYSKAVECVSTAIETGGTLMGGANGYGFRVVMEVQ